MNEAAFEEAVDAIYDAAATQEVWTSALGLIADCFGCRIATLIERNVKTSDGLGVAIGVDSASQNEFFSVWGQRNPFVQALKEKRPEPIDTDRSILSKNRLTSSDYYNQFMRQRDMHSLLRFTLQKTDDIHQSISIMGSRSFGEFESNHLRQARLFLPHLRRAGKVTQHLTLAASLIQTVSNVVELHTDAIVILSQHGEIITANRAARTMADRKDSFLLKNKRIKSIHPAIDNPLQMLILASTGNLSVPNQPRSDVIRLKRSNDTGYYIASVTRLPRQPVSFGTKIAAACIVIRDPTFTPVHSVHTFKTLFGLTPAEAKVAIRLAQGEAPEELAVFLGIGISTARSHIASIYRKMDINKQSEFLLLLNRVPVLEVS